MAFKRRTFLVALPLLLLTLLLVVMGVRFLVHRSEAPQPPLPTITVDASYPGASAEVVAEVVAAPIEEEVSGVLDMVSLTSQCSSDGQYRLTVTFKRGTDIHIAHVLVQNRVALAEPKLPELVLRRGVSVRMNGPGIFLLLVVTSPGGDREAAADYAAGTLRTELAKVKGVGGLTVIAARHDSNHSPDLALYNGKPAVVVAVHAMPDTNAAALSAAVRAKAAELAGTQPKGVQVDVAFDFTPNIDAAIETPSSEYLLLDPDLPPSPTFDERLKTFQEWERHVRDATGVQDVLILPEHPFDMAPRACMLVRLAPAEGRSKNRAQIVSAIRRNLGSFEGQQVRVRDLSAPGRFPRCGYLVDFVVYGPELAQVQIMANQLVARLRQEAELSDVWVSGASAAPAHVTMTIDRQALSQWGVAEKDLLDTLRTSFEARDRLEWRQTERTLELTIPLDGRRFKGIEQIQELEVPSATGANLPLRKLASLRRIEGPQLVQRYNLRPMVEITANPANESSLAKLRSLCEVQAAAVRRELNLSDEYRVAWLSEMP
jgi:multidrug efflux pump subunit AcrB